MVLTHSKGTRKDANDLAKARLFSLPREPLFIADWERALMIHYEVDPERLQAAVPFDLDLYDGRAYVSLVAFTMRGMRPRFGGRISEWLLKPIATNDFLNVRTYVRHCGEPGIFFMTEWLNNRLSVALGPDVFGLPYRFAKIRYHHGSQLRDAEQLHFSGRVDNGAGQGTLAYTGTSGGEPNFVACERESFDEWLMERYTAYTSMRGNARFFRIWHAPWEQMRVGIHVQNCSLVTARWPLLANARLVGANYSPGAFGVWMGWPHKATLLASKRHNTVI